MALDNLPKSTTPQQPSDMSPHSTLGQRVWWKDAIIYQIYPASFKDTNGDGLGDLQGIISKLEYIKSTGADTIWICPMYDSPQIDMGYDISDYEKVYPPYGTVSDMEELIQKAHGLELRVCLDLVVNHTSDQHKWFQESRSSKQNAKRDYYIWRPARYDKDGNRMPPNNWLSNFSEPAWSWDEHTQEYYLHLFCKEQPDLNWENEETRQAIYDSAMRFWLDKGVDGFRVDTVNMYSKGDLRDAPITNPKSFYQAAGTTYCNGPRMHEFLREMQREVFSHYNDGTTMLVGELPNTPEYERILSYVKEDDPMLSQVFQFDIVDLGTGVPLNRPKFEYTPWSLVDYKRHWTQMQRLAQDGGWPTVFMENHDQGRAISRFASDAPQWRRLSGSMLALTMATLSGTLYIYEGQEIGMINAPESWPLEEYIDVDSVNYLELVKKQENGSPEAIDRVHKSLQVLARDHSRLPFQWDDSNQYAGFTGGDAKKPWMRVHDDYREINVAAAEKDQHSILNFWRRVNSLRKQHIDLFAHGKFVCLDPEHEQTFCYLKQFGSKSALIQVNHSEKSQDATVPQDSKSTPECLVSNYDDAPSAEQPLRPYEGRLYMLQ